MKATRDRPRGDSRSARGALRDAGLAARHALSQNFLVDPQVLEDIVGLAAPTPGARVLEIGPGLGVLTAALLEDGASVTAVEIDRGLATVLRGRFRDAIARAEATPGAVGGLRLIEGDALDLDLAHLLSAPYDVVANLPYHITSPVLHALLGAPARPRRSVLMLQREVAERITAAPGQLSYLAVFVQYHAIASLGRRVPATAFEPTPNVESAVVVLESRPPGAWSAEPIHEDALWQLVQAAFRERRKMIHNVLARQLHLPAEAVAAALEQAGIAPERRPQTLAIPEWLALLAALGR